MRPVTTLCLLALLAFPSVGADPASDATTGEPCVLLTPIVQSLIGDGPVYVPLSEFADLDSCLFPVELGPQDALAGPGATLPGDGTPGLVCTPSSPDGMSYACGQDTYMHVLAVFWQHPSYEGEAFGITTLTASTTHPCRTNSAAAYATTHMPAGWNDRVSSIQTPCNVHLFQHDTYRGRDTWCYGSCSSLYGSDFDNRASSLKIW